MTVSRRVTDRKAYTVFQCSSCGNVITDPEGAMAVWDMEREDTDLFELPVHTAHKGQCLRQVEVVIEDSGGDMGSIEMVEFIADLMRNTQEPNLRSENNRRTTQ